MPTGKRGWISASLLELNLTLAEMPVAAIPPTPTPSPAEQARAFAEPLLAAIANQPPDFQDDFSDPGSGWDTGQWERGEQGYKDGKYFILSTTTTAANGDWTGPTFSDFVLEVEAQFVSGEAGSWFVILRDWREPNPPPPGFYGIQSFLNEDQPSLWKWVNTPAGVTSDLLPYRPPNLAKPGYETNQLMAILKGNRLALYVDGQPLGLATDDTWSRGAIGLAAGTHTDTPLEVHYDNLKVWDIANLLSPSTEAAAPTPAVTSAPVSSDVTLMDDGSGRRWCEPDTVKAGRIVMRRAIGRWSSPEEARAAVGDSWPPFKANEHPLHVTGLWRSYLEWHTNGADDPSPGWGFSANIETQLTPGVYNLTSLWLHDLKTCTLTVIQ